jgi:PHD/YefM family antitoxin component YafN of YafNO toxin-antitoxin module
MEHNDETPHVALDLKAILAVYESLPVSDVRSDMSSLCDDVRFKQKRIVLTRREKAVAAMVPLADLVAVHRLDEQLFEAMGRKADESGADTDDSVTLSKAKFMTQTALTLRSTACKEPSLLDIMETVITDQVVDAVNSLGIAKEHISTLRRKVIQGVHQGLYGAAPIFRPSGEVTG